MQRGRWSAIAGMHIPGMSSVGNGHAYRENFTAAVARWAELAALGYRVVVALPSEQGATLYLERSAVGGVPGPLRLPAALEQDGNAAKVLRARIEAAQAERAKLMMPAPRPTPPVETK